MKILVVGLGSIGKRHILNLLKKKIKAEEIIGVDPRQDRRLEVIKKFKVNNVYTNLNFLKNSKNIKGAIICSPTSMHTDHSIVCAKNRINLFIEKPLDKDLKRVNELEYLVKKNKLNILINYPFRFSEHARKLKEVVDKELLGRIYFYRGEFSEYLPDWHPWEDYRKFYMAKKTLGGGSILDQSHILDMAHFLFGDFKEIIGCFNSKVSSLQVKSDDIAEMIVKHNNSLVGSIHQDMIGRKHVKKMNIICEKGNILWDVYDLSVTLFYANKKIKKFTFGKDHNVMYENQTAHILEILKNKKKPFISLKDGIHTLSTILAGKHSSILKRSVKVI